MKKELLRLRSVETAASHPQRLAGVDITVCEGEILGVLGSYLSGKSILLEVMAGGLAPTDGYIFYKGKLITDWGSGSRPKVYMIRRGSSFIKNLTLWENLLILQNDSAYAGLVNPLAVVKRMNVLFEDFGIDLDPRMPAFELSNFDRYRLELLMSDLKRSELVLLDDFALQFSAEESEKLRQLISHMKNAGTSFVITSHHDNPLKYLCDRLCFIDHGRIIDCVENTEHNTAYIDNMLDRIYYRPSYESSWHDISRDLVMNIRALQGDGLAGQEDELTVQKGEIVALFDPAGQYVRRLQDLLFRPVRTGGIRLSYKGKRVRRLPQYGIKHGVAVLDCAMLENVVGWMSPAENICLGLMKNFSTCGVIRRGRLKHIAAAFCEWYGDNELENIHYGSQMEPPWRVSAWIFKLLLARPSLVICKNFNTYVDRGIQWMVQCGLELLAEQGAGILVLLTGSEVVDNFADRYIAFLGENIRDNIPYSEMIQMLKLI